MKFCPAKSKDEVAILVNEYYVELKMYSDYVFENAVENIKRYESEFPTIAVTRNYCKSFYSGEIDRLNKVWKELRDDMKSRNKPERAGFEKHAGDWRKLGIPNQADFIMQYYEEYKDYQWQPPNPEQLRAYRKSTERLAEKMEVK
jgi:hypothetical protein